MSFAISTLMCHAPIVVPAVVGARGAACAKSTAAMQEAARRVVAAAPDVVVVVSPHTPRRRGVFSLVGGARVAGHFGAFGAPEVGVDLPASPDARARIRAAARAEGLVVEELAERHAFSRALDPRAALPGRELDHGALVPLAFLVEAGWRGETVVAGLPADAGASDNDAFGRALASAAAGHPSGGGRWALVASGDCSHRLVEGAPAGFHPAAAAFDAEVARVVAAGDDAALAALDATLRELAAEDVVDTLQIAAAAAGQRARGRAVLSYEGPYGVGYLVAVLDDARAHDAARALDDARARDAARPADDAALAGVHAHVLVDVACDALAAWHEGRPRRAFDTSALDGARPAGVFVTWRTVPSPGGLASGAGAGARAGEAAEGGWEEGEEERALRGCVGRMRVDGPVCDAVAELALSAARQDPRFPPIARDEVVVPEVTLLSPSEPVASLDELDPDVWGVEVKAGVRHGVLLPAIPGVESARHQVAIALQKAGIRGHEDYDLKKFRATKLARYAPPARGERA